MGWCEKLKKSWSVTQTNMGRWYTCDDGGMIGEEIFYCPFCGAKFIQEDI